MSILIIILLIGTVSAVQLFNNKQDAINRMAIEKADKALAKGNVDIIKEGDALCEVLESGQITCTQSINYTYTYSGVRHSYLRDIRLEEDTTEKEDDALIEKIINKDIDLRHVIEKVKYTKYESDGKITEIKK